VSLHEIKRGGEAPTLTNHATSGTKTPGKPSANEDGPKGGPGGEAPMAGGVGCALFTPTKVSLFEKGRPSPTITKAGVEGAPPPPRGFGGCAPTKPERGSESPTLATRPRVGPKRLANHQLTGVGKTGVQGAKPPGRGFGGCPPKNKKKGRVAPI
jgi:hypothetical protein